MRNSLFEPYKRNHCKPSKPLGSWTTKQNAEVPDEDEEEGDDA